jgi:hypothetical protein
MKHAKRELEQKITSKEHLLKVYFSLILLLALSTIIDLHIKTKVVPTKIGGGNAAVVAPVDSPTSPTSPTPPP